MSERVRHYNYYFNKMGFWGFGVLAYEYRVDTLAKIIFANYASASFLALLCIAKNYARASYGIS
jgi:hypothetical protein